MKILNRVSLASVLFFSSTALSWEELRNGGDVMICSQYADHYTGWVTTTYMLDYYEMMVRYRLKNAPTENAFDDYMLPEQTALEFVARIPESHADLRERAAELVRSFYSETTFVNAKLYDARDAGTRVAGPNCRIEQLVLQGIPLGPEDSYYTVNKILWDQLDELQQAVAILHEVIYRLSPDDRKQYSSERVRYVVALLVADVLANRSQEQIDAVFKGIGL